MSIETEEAARRLSRRELLKRAGALGAAAALPAWAFTPGLAAQEPFGTLSPTESEILDTIVGRLIPTDDNGPGATEARAARYIDRALSDALASSRDAYAAGLTAVDAYAQASRGARFVRLPAADQDAVLRDMEGNVATGFTPDASTFFNLVRTHTI